MKQAGVLLVLVMLALEAGKHLASHDLVIETVYGAIAMMALLISATFLWLWRERATPLALGMAFSWLGTGLYAGGFWVVDLLGLPVGLGSDHTVLMVLAVCIVGALLHFAVIHRSFGRHGMGFLWPVVAVLGLSAAVVVLLGG